VVVSLFVLMTANLGLLQTDVTHLPNAADEISHDCKPGWNLPRSCRN